MDEKTLENAGITWSKLRIEKGQSGQEKDQTMLASQNQKIFDGFAFQKTLKRGLPLGFLIFDNVVLLKRSACPSAGDLSKSFQSSPKISME